MEPLQITGRIIHIGDIQDFPSGFRKRTFAVEEHADKYPQKIGMEFTKDKVLTLDQFSIGDSVEVKCNLRGNEHNGRYYLNLEAWKITLNGQEERRADQGGAIPPAKQPTVPASDEFQEEDDIPF